MLFSNLEESPSIWFRDLSLLCDFRFPPILYGYKSFGKRNESIRLFNVHFVQHLFDLDESLLLLLDIYNIPIQKQFGSDDISITILITASLLFVPLFAAFYVFERVSGFHIGLIILVSFVSVLWIEICKYLNEENSRFRQKFIFYCF